MSFLSALAAWNNLREQGVITERTHVRETEALRSRIETLRFNQDISRVGYQSVMQALRMQAGARATLLMDLKGFEVLKDHAKYSTLQIIDY